MAGRKPNRGDGEGDGTGENGDWLEMGEKEGVQERELPRDTNMVAASHSSTSKREDRSWGRRAGSTSRGRESPRLPASLLLSLDVSSQSNSLLARPRRSEGVTVPELLPPPPPPPPPVASISLVLMDRCLEQ